MVVDQLQPGVMVKEYVLIMHVFMYQWQGQQD